MDLALLDALNGEPAARRASVLVTELESGRQRLVLAARAGTDPLADHLAEAFRTGRSRLVEVGNERIFLTAQIPAPRLVITGAVHISQALAPMATTAGFDVIIVDPRTAFATPERFPGVDLRAEWPDVALARIGLDPFTALAALTHDPKIDEPALAGALAAGCFYVGALGSRKTHAARLERLAATGVSPESLARIHSPIGLDIGSVSPAEIAVAVLAEVIADLRRRPSAQEQSA